MASWARRIDVAAGTQDTALQIAWISSKPLVCSFRRPVTKSVYDIEIGFSSVTCVSVRSAATGPRKVELLASDFGDKMGRTSPPNVLTEPLESEETTGVGFEIEHVCARPRGRD